MMQARHDLGRGSKSGPAQSMTATIMIELKNEAALNEIAIISENLIIEIFVWWNSLTGVLAFVASRTLLLESETPFGKQEKNELNMLAPPKAYSS